MKRKHLILRTSIVCMISSALFTPFSYADTLQDLQSRKQQIEQKQHDIRVHLDQSGQALQGLQNQNTVVLDQIKRLELATSDNLLQVKETEKKIQSQQAALSKKEEELKELQTMYEDRNNTLENRARSLQENGGAGSYLSVLLGSKSFKDFISRSMAVNQIAEADQQLLESTEKVQKKVNKQKKAVTKKLEQLESAKAELEEMSEALDAQQQQKKTLGEQLKVKLTDQQVAQTSLADQQAALSNQVQSIEFAMTKEQQRLQAEEQQKAEERRNAQVSVPVENPVTQPATPSVPEPNPTAPTPPAEQIPTTPVTSHSSVLEAGSTLIGRTVYKFGGGRTKTDINNGLFDCSSFVHWAYAQIGVDLGNRGWVSTETLKNKGRAVAVSDMQPGDLVFFDTYKKDGHVGIYAGNGKFLGCQGKSGVAYADMTKGYFKKKFNGRVRRI
ncbi:PcsB-like coiled-coil domain-containing protein [Priestia koreensis]|uniref:C40 family peptidase n=2 Tax=Priestia koreensis TaxID=284581 RepID=UPI00203BD084|nr:NlpC/P60 family protein [Priestia koreensis]